jgi:flagellar protein FliS
MIPINRGSDPRGRYRAGAVSTARPAQLVTMLYDAAIAAVQRAETALAEQPSSDAIQRAHEDLTKAQDIMVELQLSLDHDRGGEIAGSLDALYDFCLDRLVAANTSKSPQLLPAVTSVLSELRDAWLQASEASSW